MPLPFLAWGAIAAVTTAVATSEECNRCGDTFWSSDCSYYCDDCCRNRRNEARAESARKEAREKEKEEHNEKVMREIENYQDERITYIEDKYNTVCDYNISKVIILFENSNFKNSIIKLENKSSELAQLRKELEVMKYEDLS